MPRIRYQCPVPERPGMTAFAPVPAHYGQSWFAYKQDVIGHPGTQAIPAPYPGTFNDLENTWYVGGQSESVAMPPEWYPSLYYLVQKLWGGIGGVSVFSDNLLPTPAIDPRLMGTGKAIKGPVAMTGHNDYTQPVGRQSGSQKQTTWPRKVIKFKDLMRRG